MKKIQIVIVLLFVPGIFSLEPVIKIAGFLTEYIKTGEEPLELQYAVAELLSLPNKTYQDEQVCATCRYVVGGVINFSRNGVQKEEMLKLIKYLCNTFSTHGTIMCNSIADKGIDAMLYIIDKRKNITADRVCSIYLQHRLCEDPDEYEWTINMAEEPEKLADYPLTRDWTTLKVLHLTDIHVDPLYTPQSDAYCEKPLCCQNGTPNSTATLAGYWGDYHKCDMPWHSVVNLLEHTKAQQKDISFVYFTGDIIAHTWETTKSMNTKVIRQLMKLFDTYFPDKTIFPVLGNHEAHPCDYYAPLDSPADDGISTQWLFDLVADEWSKWLPASAIKTIKKGGYYTVLVKKGLRLIALNSNVCYIPNLWLIENDVDPYGQLQWLADTLAEAERMGEYIHILSHIPPGGMDCWRIWMQNFNKIIERFSKIIKAQFNGHTHKDELRVFLNENKTRAINVAYNGGSFTTFVGHNPNYRVYEVNADLFDVVDYEQWIYNLTAANLNPTNHSPNWYQLYTFRDAYNMKAMNLSDFFDLTQRMAIEKDRSLLKNYHRFTVRDSDVQMKLPCDDKCLDRLMCSITGMDFLDARKCV